ncbi:MAG: hypothetical protein AABZ12_07480 [Planctomycetota bacterium]
MRTRSVSTSALMTFAGLAVFSASAPSQVVINGGTAHDNVSNSGARAPGRMVNSGVTRTLEAMGFARNGVEITETGPQGPDPRSAFAADALTGLFQQLNVAILAFENILRARVGLPPRIPVVGGGDDGRGDDGGRGDGK